MQYLNPGRTARRLAVSSLAGLGCAVLSAFASTALATDAATADPVVQRGRYLVQIAGCNDCHTPGYLFNNGNVPEELWLTGSPVGWNGPWGTTYAKNLRLVADKMNEERWLRYARMEWLPPMPWFNLRAMSDADLLAIYRYLRHMGPAGEKMPAALPPGEEPPGPVFRAPAPPPGH